MSASKGATRNWLKYNFCVPAQAYAGVFLHQHFLCRLHPNLCLLSRLCCLCPDVCRLWCNISRHLCWLCGFCHLCPDLCYDLCRLCRVCRFCRFCRLCRLYGLCRVCRLCRHILKMHRHVFVPAQISVVVDFNPTCCPLLSGFRWLDQEKFHL